MDSLQRTAVLETSHIIQKTLPFYLIPVFLSNFTPNFLAYVKV